MFKFSILVPFFLVYLGKDTTVLVNGQSDAEMYCNAAYCSEVECSDKPLNCSSVGFRQFLSPKPCNCCKYCFNYLKEGDTCQTTLDSSDPPEHVCGPQLQCDVGSETCTTMRRENGTCMYELEVYKTNEAAGKVGIAQFKPECDAHGSYDPRQCLPGSICFCMSDVGKRIFGVGTPNEPMDCACARDVDRIKSFGFKGTFPRCLSNGDYDELQCSVYTRRCICMTKPDESVAIQNIADLPCFREDFHPAPPDTPYLRPCELARSDINYEVLKTLYGVNGSTVMVSDMPVCAPDGNYDLIQSRYPKWVCVDPNGNQIESFEADIISSTPGNMNCYCAMTRFMSSASTGKPKCCPNGNFYGLQCSGKTCYCVDELGRQDMSLAEVGQDNMEDLPCYENPCQ